jgi:hypothetical protein
MLVEATASRDMLVGASDKSMKRRGCPRLKSITKRQVGYHCKPLSPLWLWDFRVRRNLILLPVFSKGRTHRG